MKIVLCPGIHPPKFTERFMESLGQPLSRFCIIPSDRIPVYSPRHVLALLPPSPILLIGFSAGVVGAIGAARLRQSGTVRGLIAIDGWGVPLAGDFPIHRVSHDFFTHWSSALLGAGSESFYADPAVDHLTLWHSPQTVAGQTSSGHSTTADCFINALIKRYE